MPKRFKVWTDIANLVPEAKALVAEVGDLIGPNLAELSEADAVLANPVQPWNAEVFAKAPKLQVVSRSGIGYDNVEVEAATQLGICVTNTPDAPTIATAEFTIALLLAMTRKIALADRRIRAEGWVNSTPLTGVDLAEKTLGLVGFGRIGKRVAEVARALRMNVVIYDPFVTPEAARALGVSSCPDLTSLLKSSDIVSLHIPLSKESRGMIGAPQLAIMKKGAMLINAARGPVVIGSALYDALKSGHLAGAAIDVWDPEPTSKDNPLLSLDNLVATPHIASATAEGRVRNNSGAARCALAVLRGEKPASLVNPQIWETRRK